MPDDPIARRRDEERFSRAAVTAALTALGIVVAPALPLPVLCKLLETARRAFETEGDGK